MFTANSDINANGQTPAGETANQRVYLCESGIIHVKCATTTLFIILEM